MVGPRMGDIGPKVSSEGYPGTPEDLGIEVNKMG